jgi:hypothetical protein
MDNWGKLNSQCLIYLKNKITIFLNILQQHKLSITVNNGSHKIGCQTKEIISQLFNFLSQVHMTQLQILQQALSLI